MNKLMENISKYNKRKEENTKKNNNNNNMLRQQTKFNTTIQYITHILYHIAFYTPRIVIERRTCYIYKMRLAKIGECLKTVGDRISI